ncbi:hypothetical protein UlMin_013377 [Ulmus minor]
MDQSSSDHSKPEKNNSEKNDNYQIVSSLPRSYECTFCKRGFSNAQALGGHMNIHRKDKAKLKLLASSTVTQQQQKQSSSEIPKISSSNLSSVPIGSLDGNPSPNWFVEKESDDQLSKFSGFVDQKEELPVTLSSSDHDISELDLELRLGPEPQDSTSKSTGMDATRKFF